MNSENLTATTDTLRREMRTYYRQLQRRVFEGHTPMVRIRAAIWNAMDHHAADHSNNTSAELKAQLHQEIAERFEPVLFPHTPFYFEMGLRPAENWGTPYAHLPAEWLLERRLHLAHDHPAFANVRALGFKDSPFAIAQEHVFDADHHALGSTRLLDVGVNGLLDAIEERRRQPLAAAQAAFLRAAETSCRAVLHIAGRFADKADDLLMYGDHDDQATRFLKMISSTARRVPANPPTTFYEGLAALWFLREVAATVEALGISVIGHPDRQLIGLYRSDVSAGHLTEDEACDLIARWLLPTDIKFFIEENAWPETSTCIELGGCDADGKLIFNELTRLFIEVHAELGLLNPKLQCRFSADAPEPYLDLVSDHILRGRNVFSLLNDDVLIPACVRSGKTVEQARCYVNGGCQETIVEGVEHSAGAYYYFNMPRILDLCLQPTPKVPLGLTAPEAGAVIPRPIEDAPDFEAFYTEFMEALKTNIAAGAAWRREAASQWPDIHPAPFFSSTLAGCIEQAQDYTAGGALHNAAGIALVGLATLIDALHAIRVAVYDEAWLSLSRLRQALAYDWEGAEALRARLIALPKFGHGDPDVDGLAVRFATELAPFIRTLENERGGNFQASFFVYYQFVHMGRHVRATPDGRRAGDLLSQGVGPSHLNPPESLTAALKSLSSIDLRDYPANAVLDAQLPLGSALPKPVLTALLRTFAEMGGATFQPNVVSLDALQDAQRHPERHRDLVVRICGLSAHFVSLDRAVQDEIIARHTAG